MVSSQEGKVIVGHFRLLKDALHGSIRILVK